MPKISVTTRKMGGSLLFLLAFLAACSGSSPATVAEEDKPEKAAPSQPAVPEGNPFAILETNKGTIVIQLLPEVAPKTVENFIELTRAGFYSKTRFHRILTGTMIQGGDPNSKDNDPYNDGKGNSGRFIKAEFNKEKFERGTVAMARQPTGPDTASSQFFICLKRAPHWDGEYTVFGKVTEGIEVADEISKAPRSKDPNLKERPAGRMEIERARIEYRK